MVKRALLLAVVFVSVCVQAITPDELKRLSEKGAADKRRVDSQLNLKDLRYSVQPKQEERSESGLPDNKEKVDASIGLTGAAASLTGSDTNPRALDAREEVGQSNSQSQPFSQKYQTTSNHALQPHPQTLRQAERDRQSHRETIDQSIATQKTGFSVPAATPHFSDAVKHENKKHYGIRRGTWIQAELRRNVNSAEPGDVEIHITQEVHGDKRTLSVGTQIFSNKAYNAATQRLDMLVTYAITPDGHEFDLKARIYDMTKVSGLMGILDVDANKIAERGTSRALTAAGSTLLGGVASNNAVGQAITKGGSSMLQDTQKAMEQDTSRQITIYVAPQPLLLRVEATF